MPSEFHNREPPPSPLEILKAVRGIGMDIFWNRLILVTALPIPQLI